MENMYSESEDRPNVLIDIGGAEARFALHRPDTGLISASIRRYPTDRFPTATDCIQAFARDADIRLSGLRCAMSISGAISGDAVRIARCSWIISVNGLGYLFQNPVTVLNSTAAMLWAALDTSPETHNALGTQMLPDFSKGGKWLGINFNTGLGAALLTSADGQHYQHVETEAGQTGFTPYDSVEEALAKQLGRTKNPVSWEQAVLAPELGQLCAAAPGMSTLASESLVRTQILASFIGDTVLATGAWDGIFLFGRCADMLQDRAQRDAFALRLEKRANLQLKLRAVPRWSVNMPNANLIGAARFLANQSPLRT